MITPYGNAYQRKDGYYQISSGIHKGKLLHRLIYEDNFGIIPEGFCVHHRDNDKENNDPSNLIILTKSNHHKLHCQGHNHPRWNKSKIDFAGGISFLSAAKNKGLSIADVAVDLSYTNPAPVYQYLNKHNLRWNSL